VAPKRPSAVTAGRSLKPDHWCDLWVTSPAVFAMSSSDSTSTPGSAPGFIESAQTCVSPPCRRSKYNPIGGLGQASRSAAHPADGSRRPEEIGRSTQSRKRPDRVTRSGRFRCRRELPLQGSNLDFPDPESGVLPVTPRGSEPPTVYRTCLRAPTPGLEPGTL
jgi:hypothetical protein